MEKLSDEDIELAKRIGRERQEYNQRVGANYTPYGWVKDVDPILFKQWTVGGEIFVCRKLGLEPEFENGNYESHDIWYKDMLIDVKTKPTFKDRWSVKENKNWKVVPDYFACVTGWGIMNNPVELRFEYEFGGFVMSPALMLAKNLKSGYDNSRMWVVDPNLLTTKVREDMSVFLSLTKDERMLARLMEMNILLSINTPEEQAEQEVTGIREGAKIAVARILNLFPVTWYMPGCDLISKKGQTIKVVITKGKQKSYEVKEPYADVFVLVYTGEGDTYEVVGYAQKKNILHDKQPAYIFDHVFQAFTEANIFPELIKRE